MKNDKRLKICAELTRGLALELAEQINAAPLMFYGDGPKKIMESYLGESLSYTFPLCWPGADTFSCDHCEDNNVWGGHRTCQPLLTPIIDARIRLIPHKYVRMQKAIAVRMSRFLATVEDSK